MPEFVSDGGRWKEVKTNTSTSNTSGTIVAKNIKPGDESVKPVREVKDVVDAPIKRTRKIKGGKNAKLRK